MKRKSVQTFLSVCLVVCFMFSIFMQQPIMAQDTDKVTSSKVGDVSGDGNINSIDFALMKQLLLGIIAELPAEDGLKASDLNGDDSFNSVDFAIMRIYLLGMIPDFPVNTGNITPTPVVTSTPTKTAIPGPTITPIKVTTDWSVKVVDSTMKRSSKVSGWGYWNGFYLSMVYRVYKRTNDAKYLNYLKTWADSCIDSSGNIKTTITSLDLIQPGLVLILLYKETGEQKYKTAATKIRKIFDTYPCTADGGFWHMTKGTSANPKLGIGQLWLDGTYMSTPFLVAYGSMFNDSEYCNNEAVNQLLIYASHLRDPNTGLLYHAYDEDGSESWADRTTHHSPDFWGRSIGWYGMALIEVLEVLPADYPKRQELIKILKELIDAFARYQSDSGLWYQVVNKGTQSGNWLETSCSCMYTYTISRAVERGYVDSSYQSYANKGFKGVLTKISMGSDGLTNLTDICVGTDVGDYNYYINRKKSSNDSHGLGAFIVCFEQMYKNQ
ncbi:glycoside hydrolase family 88 protein [Acetivibrio cellulolyticus]|uniref:glycoside hydrolase family 88 protein n=1 Tax=Acetivibrio cellulolyticus TaxID=35830 RepID=UPI0001E2F0BE|nr:glycoside hydrolase family 88 protein [Acetivibrio cellulolyticus]